MKYVTNHFVEQVCEQIYEQKIELISSHVLIKFPEDNLKEFQFKPILATIKEQLIAAFRNDKRLI